MRDSVQDSGFRIQGTGDRGQGTGDRGQGTGDSLEDTGYRRGEWAVLKRVGYPLRGNPGAEGLG
ncbi:hypothetical protein GCM10027217_05380 [Pseudomaricurvus hydrocarbonicus]